MGYPILDNLRKLDVTNIDDVLGFLEKAEKTCDNTNKLLLQCNPDLKQDHPLETTIVVNVKHLTDLNEEVTDEDLERLNNIYKLLEENNAPEIESGHSTWILTAIIGIFETFQLEKEIQEAEALVSSLLPTTEVDPKNRLFQVDAALAEELDDRNATTSMELSSTNQSQDEPTLSTLSKLANQLVEAAERRKEDFPEEKHIASRLRLAINTQRIKPIDQQRFRAKLAPRLRDAQRVFGRHRNSFALRILAKIAVIAAIVITGVVPGLVAQGIYSAVKYKETGKVRFLSLSNRTAAQDTVASLAAATGPR